MGIVVGIFSDADPQALQRALASQSSIDFDKIRVITSSEPSRAHADAPFDFVHVIEAQLSNSLSDDMTRGTGIMSDAGGTNVPGISRGATLSEFHHGAAADYLSGIGVPDDEVDNFNQAIADHKSVIVYVTPDPTTQIETLKAAGLRNVRAY